MICLDFWIIFSGYEFKCLIDLGLSIKVQNYLINILRLQVSIKIVLQTKDIFETNQEYENN